MSKEIVKYDRQVLITGALESLRQLTLGGEDLYPGYYAVQVPVTVGKQELLVDVLCKTLVPGATRPEVRASTRDEVVHASAALGELVRACQPVSSDQLPVVSADSLVINHPETVQTDQMPSELEGEMVKKLSENLERRFNDAIIGKSNRLCPQCQDHLIIPRGFEPYCENCGYPDENRPKEVEGE